MIEITNANGDLIVDSMNPVMQLASSSPWVDTQTASAYNGYAGYKPNIYVAKSAAPFMLNQGLAGGDIGNLDGYSLWTPWASSGAVHTFTTEVPSAQLAAGGGAGLQLFGPTGLLLYDSRTPPLELVDALNLGSSGPQFGFTMSGAVATPPSTGISIASPANRKYSIWCPSWRVIARYYQSTIEYYNECVVVSPGNVSTVFYHSGTSPSQTNYGDGYWQLVYLGQRNPALLIDVTNL